MACHRKCEHRIVRCWALVESSSSRTRLPSLFWVIYLVCIWIDSIPVKTSHPICIKAHGRLRHRIDQTRKTLLFLLSSNPKIFSSLNMLFFLRLYSDLRCSRWLANPRTTLSPPGSVFQDQTKKEASTRQSWGRHRTIRPMHFRDLAAF